MSLPFNGQKAPVITQVPKGTKCLTGDECPTLRRCSGDAEAKAPILMKLKLIL